MGIFKNEGIFQASKTGCNINVRTYVKSWNSCIQIEIYQLSILEELGQIYS